MGLPGSVGRLVSPRPRPAGLWQQRRGRLGPPLPMPWHHCAHASLRRWPWTAFAASCSTAGYVFLYSVRRRHAWRTQLVLAQCSRPSRAGLLLFRQNEDVRFLPDHFLLWIQCAAAPVRELVQRCRPRVVGPALRCLGATYACAAATTVLIFCVALGVMCGTLGYCGCSVFVRRIYVNIKSD